MRKNSATISVIIPVFNAEDYIRECLDSIFSQTLTELEVICIDDCSTDLSCKILEEYQAKTSALKLLRMDTNSGSGPARNKGINHAKGQYICFMDPDDMYPANDVLETLYEYAENDQQKMIGGNLIEFYCNDKQTAKDWGRATFTQKGFIDKNDYPYSTGYTRFLYNADWLKNTNIRFQDLRRYQDPVWFARILYDAGGFYALDKPVYLRRVNNQRIRWNVQKIQHVFIGMHRNIDFFKYHNMQGHLKNEEKNLTGFLVTIIKSLSRQNLNLTDLIKVYFKEFGFILSLYYIIQIFLDKSMKLIKKV